MKTKPYLLASGTLFAVLATLQTLRLVNEWPAQIGTLVIPLWPSGLFACLAGSLCVWAFRLTKSGSSKIFVG